MPMLNFSRPGVLPAMAAIVLILFLQGRTNKQAIEIRKEDELSLPVTEKKLVMAHCMTNIIRFKGHKLEDSCDPEYYAPKGNITAPLGGLTQVNVLSDPFL